MRRVINGLKFVGIIAPGIFALLTIWLGAVSVPTDASWTQVASASSPANWSTCAGVWLIVCAVSAGTIKR